MLTTVDRIHLIWCWCCDAYLRIAERRLNLPKDTDPTKTYQWRYLEALHNKFIEWEFDDSLCRAFIDTTVRYAVERHLLNKGLSIFLQNNTLKVCHDRMREQARRSDDTLSILRRTKTWLYQQVSSSGTDLVGCLLLRGSIGAYPNIVRWHQGGNLPEVYLALSRSCGVVTARLAQESPAERAMLPNNTRLFLAHNSALSSPKARIDIRSILQDDWRRPCRA